MRKKISTLDELWAQTKSVAPSVIHSNYTELPGEVVEFDDFGAIAIKGPVQYVRGERAEGYFSEIHEDDQTFADVLRAMQVSIDRTLDKHHVFFEGFRVIKRVAGVAIVSIHTGS